MWVKMGPFSLGYACKGSGFGFLVFTASVVIGLRKDLGAVPPKLSVLQALSKLGGNQATPKLNSTEIFAVTS